MIRDRVGHCLIRLGSFALSEDAAMRYEHRIADRVLRRVLGRFAKPVIDTINYEETEPMEMVWPRIIH